MKVLILNQCFYPDVVSTAQHATDAALALTEAGHEVTVVASSRGYDEGSRRFPKIENWRGIRIFRVASTNFGKSVKWRRAVDFATFWLSCTLRLLRLEWFDVVVSLTSPPLISLAGTLFTRLKGGKTICWVMDLNPDEAIAAGWLRPNSFAARALRRAQHYSFDKAEKIVVLDRFMEKRVGARGIGRSKIEVIPPWSHDDKIHFDSAGRETFRSEHGLDGKFVVMYSGNHSPCHPLDTVLEAAKQLFSNEGIVFCFVGGGSEFRKVQQFASEQRLGNVRCFPYEPLENVAASLSAADLHVVVMGDEYPGIVHPCKIYNILLVGSPFLYIGPRQSHIWEIITKLSTGKAFFAHHGDVAAVVEFISHSAQQFPEAGEREPFAIAKMYSKSRLAPRLVSLVEAAHDDLVASPIPVCSSKRAV